MLLPEYRLGDGLSTSLTERGENEGGSRIEVRQLTRRFGNHTALDCLEFDIDRGETFGLLGANGAGKTTFIRMVTGFLMPTSGSVTVDGVSPASNPREVQRGLGYVAETSRLYPELRVEGFLHFAGRAHGLSGAELRGAVERTLEPACFAGGAVRDETADDDGVLGDVLPPSACTRSRNPSISVASSFSSSATSAGATGASMRRPSCSPAMVLANGKSARVSTAR